MDFKGTYNQKVTLDIEFNGKIRTLPVNPENLAINRGASNSDINIVGLGPAVRKAHPGLITMKISSFFPSPYSPYFKYDVTPEEYIDFIYGIWETPNKDNKVAKLVTRGLDKNFSMWFVIDNFTYQYKGGDLDVYYELSIKEYVPYGVRIESFPTTGMAVGRPVSTNKVTATTNKTYVVSSGDSLWSIAKRSTGNGSNWQALYELNKDVIGANPNKLKIGTVLVLPDDWTVPAKVTSTKSTKKNTAVKSTATTQQPTIKAGNEQIADPILSKATSVANYVPQYTQTIQVTNVDKKKMTPAVAHSVQERDKALKQLTKLQSKATTTVQEDKEMERLYNTVKSYDQAVAGGWAQYSISKDTGKLMHWCDESGTWHHNP